ncbi:MAG: 2-succinyl-5-enolpyruvyl-6-hydroxy-3-cyclohexene-1-carboxylic-acid synthase [Chitinophagales bacterium]|nr:2-succinyl-5-enolpyruvyl-6-hydroxy-3-cyclohexene-1-carboxylic-acid synthase [Chitinophagales bacterium]
MTLSNKKGVQHIVLALAELGIKEVIICPGSRNAPLVISFNRHPNFICTSIRDERSAGFFALGKSIESKQPVVLVCTSGSAVLNFAPAIVEAYYQRIPLIIITADRPTEWVDQGDGQTIKQHEIYNNYIQKSYTLDGDSADAQKIWHIARSISEGVSIATSTNKGPVHFNISMNEPLYKTEEININSTVSIFKTPITQEFICNEQLQEFATQFSSTKKILFLIGQLQIDKELESMLIHFAKQDNVIVLTESTSNVHHPDFIENIDRCITNLGDEAAKALMPDLLVTMGGAIVSKRIKSLLRKFRPAAHWNIHPYDATMDTYQSLTTAISMQPTAFLTLLSQYHIPVNSDYKNNWQQLQQQKVTLQLEFEAIAPFSDFKVFQKTLSAIPKNTILHVANSSPVRYVQLFDNSHIAETWSNRGTSGIDGCTSTAMGAAAAAPEKSFVLITGDVSFQYDINALWNDQQIQNLKIIIINNGGGGIFRIIEGPNSIDERSEFLETAMTTHFAHIAQHFSWNYIQAKDEQTLNEALLYFFNPDNKRIILEIFTDAKNNPVVLADYWNHLKN